MPERPSDNVPMNVVVRTDDGAISLLVDEIGDVVEVQEEQFERSPEQVKVAVNKAGHKGLAFGVDGAGVRAAPVSGLGVAPHESNTRANHGHCFGVRVGRVGGEDASVRDEEVREG